MKQPWWLGDPHWLENTPYEFTNGFWVDPIFQTKLWGEYLQCCWRAQHWHRLSVCHDESRLGALDFKERNCFWNRGMLIKLQLTIGFLGGILESRRDCEQVGTSKSIGWSWLIIISLLRKLPLKGCTQFPDKLIWEHPCIYIYSILIYHTHTHIYIYICIYIIHHYISIFQVKTQNILKWQSHPWSLDFWGHRSSCLQSCLWGPQIISTVFGEEKVTWVGGVDKKTLLCGGVILILEHWKLDVFNSLCVRKGMHTSKLFSEMQNWDSVKHPCWTRKAVFATDRRGVTGRNIPKESVN